MLKHGRDLVKERRKHKSKHRIHFPSLALIRKWLRTGGEEEGTRFGQRFKTVADYRQANDKKKIDDTQVTEKHENTLQQCADRINHGSSRIIRLRETAADIVDWFMYSDDIHYAFRLTIGVLLVTFPAFIEETAHWYYLARAGTSFNRLSSRHVC